MQEVEHWSPFCGVSFIARMTQHHSAVAVPWTVSGVSSLAKKGTKTEKSFRLEVEINKADFNLEISIILLRCKPDVHSFFESHAWFDDSHFTLEGKYTKLVWFKKGKISERTRSPDDLKCFLAPFNKSYTCLVTFQQAIMLFILKSHDLH